MCHILRRIDRQHARHCLRRSGIDALNFRVSKGAADRHAMRHSGGDVIRISLAQESGAAVLTVGDNGRGDVDDGGGGFGLRTMAERAARIGAELILGASDLGGVEICLKFQRAAR